MAKKLHRPENINFNTMESEVPQDTLILNIQSKLGVFKNPYVGNKRKLLPFLIQAINKQGIEYNSVLDLFCGSAYVSMAMKLLDKRVICNDILESSCTNARAFVTNHRDVLTKEEKKYLTSNVRDADPNPVFNNYKDRFSEAEIKKINDYRLNVDDLFSLCTSSPTIWMKRILSVAYLQNYIMEKCFLGGRLNSGQVLAKLDHRLNHKRNQGKEMTFNDIRWTKPIYPNDPNCHLSMNKDAIDLLENYNKERLDVGLCYIDPPYGGDQSDYAVMYEFFEMLHTLQNREERETPLVAYDDWQKEDMRKIAAGKKKFISSKNYEEHFDKLISLTTQIPWIVISYNDTSWGKIDDIRKIIEKYRNRVIIEEVSYSYKYRKQDNNKKDTKEFII
ncbi:hypothetical protein LCGC14_1840270, partial [marine sediment metagenome]